MGFVLSIPDVDELDDVVAVLARWQRDDAPIQLHPGDLGWCRRLGAKPTAAAVRTWSRDGHIVAIAFADGVDVLRLTVAPDAWTDVDLARRVAADVSDPDRGVLPAGAVSIEAPDGTAVRALLDDDQWRLGDGWTPLSRDLTERVDAPRARVEVVVPGTVAEFTAVHRAAWASARFTDERWRDMAGGTLFADARCLLGRDDAGVAVGGITLWSAGAGRPGLIEPLGVHPDHRGHGHGRALCVAAAAELQRLGASSALVCTESSRPAAIATYESAGFRRLPERRDRTREA